MTIEPWEVELNNYIELLHFANGTFEEYVSYKNAKQLLAAAHERIVKLERVISNLSEAWFDYCQNVRDDVPEHEIYNVLAVRDGRKTIEEIRQGMDKATELKR